MRNQGGYRMNRGKGFILALVMAVLPACASGGGGGGGMEEEGGGRRPTDNAATRSAGVHLAQAATAEGAVADEHYRAALNDALSAIQQEPDNPKAYLVAGQAAVGVGNWVQADTMFDRAVALYPGYASSITSEREEAWVTAYNRGIEALNTSGDAAAIEFFRGADLLYQERPEAKMILGALNMRLGDTEAAIEAYGEALDILYGPVPEGLPAEQTEQWAEDRQTAAVNLAQLHAQAGNYERAASTLDDFLQRSEGTLDAPTELQVLTLRANYLAQAGRADAAEALYNDLLTRSDLGAAEYFQIGIGMFNSGDYVRAADAFRSAAEANPYSRDALLNLVQSLYSEAVDLEEQPQSAERDARLREIYNEVVQISEQVREFDPLNRNLLSFMLRAYRGLSELAPRAEAERFRAATQDLFREYQAQAYEVSDIALSLEGGNRARVTGVLTNLAGTAGSGVQLRFTVVNRGGEAIDSEVVEITAPATGQSVEFSTTVDLSAGDFAGWRYEVIG